MSASTRGTMERYAGASLEDCVKLWSTVRNELMADAQISLDIPNYVEPSFRPALTVHTLGWDEETGKPIVRVWGTRVLQNDSIGFTYNGLYELLIASYRAMDGFLRGQEELPAL
jgi:hypothetical protein